jgi:hypothetical protein
MNRGFLKFCVALLATLMVVVPFVGFDSLPRSLRARIDSERSSLAASQNQVRSSADAVNRDLAAEPELFRGVAAATAWPAQLSAASDNLQIASRDMQQLTTLERQNRRQDRERAEQLLSQTDAVRNSSTALAVGIQKEADHWVDLKRHLPEELARMDQDYRSIRSFDFGPVSSTVQKAEVDWPDKKTDLDSRLANLRGLASQSETLWNSTAEARRDAGAGQLGKVDVARLIDASEALHGTAVALPRKSAELTALSGQLYNAWDKLLVDMDVKGRGDSRDYRQQIRTVTTHLADASAKTGDTNSQDQWVTVSRADYDARKNDLGMAIEHKPAGKYDTEADRVAQPAGFAYMASPAQGRNQYGYWDHRDGRDFWVWYGQYSLLRDLLFNHDYRPLNRGDWDGYRTYQDRGQTYYGGSGSSGQQYGTRGSTTQERYSGSTFSRNGGFKDSEYASKSGSYRGSRYSSPGSRNPDFDSSPHRFGSHAPSALPPSRSFRPSPSFHMPSRSLGRRFGRR